MELLAVIQDSWSPRFNENRTLLPLNGHTCLEEIVRRLRVVQEIDDIVLITSDLPKDNKLADFAAALGLEVFRGDERDVLSRTMLPIEKYHPAYVAKIPGAYPLIDSNHISQMIAYTKKCGFDLATCECRSSIVRGLGIELIRRTAIEEISNENLNSFQREFHTQFLKQHPERFRIFESRSSLSRPEYSLAVDIRRDYLLVKEIVRHLGSEANESSIVSLLDKNPHLAEINARPKAQEIGLDKLMLFPEKISKIQSVISGEQILDPSYPISVELSLTDNCPMTCIWCSDANMRSRESATIDTESVFRLVDDLKKHGTRGVVIEGGGEPTQHPEFDRIVDHISNRGLGVGLITNGLRTLSPETIEQFEWIRVSLDAGSPQEFQALKGVDGFEQVIENIQKMVKHCPVVGIGYVLTNRNYENLENLIFLLQKLNVSYLYIRPVVDHPDLTLTKDMGYLQDFTYHQFPVMLNALSENARSGNSGLPCLSHSLATVISSSGNVYICGRLNIYDWVKPLGNINKSSFNEIWTGKERELQAKQLLDKDFCTQHCPQCRMTKFNVLFDKQSSINTKNFI